MPFYAGQTSGTTSYRSVWADWIALKKSRCARAKAFAWLWSCIVRGIDHQQQEQKSFTRSTRCTWSFCILDFMCSWATWAPVWLICSLCCSLRMRSVRWKTGWSVSEMLPNMPWSTLNSVGMHLIQCIGLRCSKSASRDDLLARSTPSSFATSSYRTQPERSMCDPRYLNVSTIFRE